MILRRTAAAIVAASMIVVGSAVSFVAPATAATTAVLAAPESLSTRVMDGDLQFRWSGVDGATGYTIEVATDDQFATSNIIATRTTTARTWIPERTLGASEARGLYWRVAAHSSGTTAASRGDYSAPQTVEVAAAGTPELLSPVQGATVDYPSAVAFRWTPVPGAVSYTLTYTSDPSWPSGSPTTVVTGLTGTAYAPPAPLARTSSGAPVQWYWKVQAVFGSPVTATSTSTVTGPAQAEPGTFTVRWTAASSAPTLVSPVGTSTIQSDLKFTWTPVAGATKYVIVIGQAVDDATGVVTTTKISAESTSTTYVPLVQLVDGNYWWQVTAYDPAGNPGQPSSAVEFRKAWGGQTAATTSATSFSKTYPQPTFGSTQIQNPTTVALDELLLTWAPVPRATLYEVEAIPVLSSSEDTRKTLYCRTASTSATIVAKVVEGANDGAALDGDAACLWNSNRAQRMDAGGLYEWRVRAIDYSGSATTTIQAATPAGSQESLWSDVDNGDTSRKRYFTVGSARVGTAATAAVDTAAWSTEASTTLGKPAPLMTWSPVAGANAYQVAVYHDYDCSVLVTTQYTMQTRLRINGVFDDETSGEYCWQVRGISMNDSFSEYTTPVGSTYTSGAFWQKSSTRIDFTGVSPTTTASDGSVVFAWRPQASSAPADGGSRGYAVTVLDSSLTSKGTIKVEYPTYVAKTLDAAQKPLAPGSYYFKVAALDALGNAGNYTENVPFTVAAPAPTALSAQVDGTSATLSWTGTTAAAKYGVKVRAVGSAWPTSPTQVTQTAAAVRDLDDGTYEWIVSSYDNSGYLSLESAVGTFTVAAPAPALATPDGAVLTSADRVLDWAAVPGASRYLVQYATAPGSLDSATAAETTSTSYAIPSTLNYGTTYYWQVTAVPEKTNTSSTRVKLGRSTFGTFSVVNPPAGVTISKVSIIGTQAAVEWVTPAGANRGSADAPAFRLAYRASNPTGAETAWTVLNVEAGVESRTLTGLAVDTTYEFQLQAYNAEGGSAWSAVRSATTPGAPKAAVTSLAATATTNSLKVSWRALSSSSTGGSAVTGYAVKYRKGSGAWVTVSSALASTGTSVTVSGLASSSSYAVSVAAVNAVGTGPAATLSTATLALPSAPRSVKATRGDRTALVSWTAPSSNGGAAISGYALEYRAKDPKKGTWGPWATRATSATTVKVTLTGLTNGTSYQVRVSARSALGTGTASTAVSFVPATKPAAPRGVKATATGSKKIKVAWTKSTTNGSTISGYQVQYSTTGKSWKTLTTAKSSATSYTWTKATKGKKYFFRVIARSNLGSSPASGVVKVVAR
ncbi:fibronectin type III domain-containing protein [Cellulomonas rhizosphaerae]|uniref:Fibronectin type III domain-containing protein n=1 Tax=Cellulomonas rhizosphaerae TaxID=2293719 RepID=A0A413RK53_9CELL|nr:fibronectin type III domain-containing protein [Cellulomonas rhizosphaerae]RHA39234.1 fibronectin type III domain-containing protein [Cellulomonas rhizosphaerae]